ncbi:EAL domain-containing protein [Subtercola sp. PAMC28395]|uniref:putative bifunctional diguanylate cyclase/phosphodiesterase n=1 Tax=Subtercola sp. PAMC28395 TaxID=2846775 RepID=UPI001C0B18B2|nr:bifunctional diguanylate cyclase/phosphodiesterase [Subtercola sp. PAMC28395]QWT24856.1 EAL domain-containing protein [Subtercola sp. PAMC28395]
MPGSRVGEDSVPDTGDESYFREPNLLKPPAVSSVAGSSVYDLSDSGPSVTDLASSDAPDPDAPDPDAPDPDAPFPDAPDPADLPDHDPPVLPEPVHSVWSEIRVAGVLVPLQIGRAYFWPVSAAVVAVLVLGALNAAKLVFSDLPSDVAAPADLAYFLALFVSTLLVTDFRLSVGRLASLPSVSLAVSLLVTVDYANQFFLSIAVWTLGFFFGLLLNSRNPSLSLYGSGLAALGATTWVAVVKTLAGADVWPVAYIPLATAAYLTVILGIEFARQKGRWSIQHTFGVSGFSSRRLLGVLFAISALALAIGYIYSSLYVLLVEVNQTHRAAGIILLAGAILFLASKWRQQRALRRRLKGLTDAALRLPWDTSRGLEAIAVEMVNNTIVADHVDVRATKPGHNEIGYSVRLAPDQEAYLVASREVSAVPFARDDERALEALAHLATEAARVTEDMADLVLRANSDSLTGLPNYSAFRTALAKANEERSYSGAIAVLFIDLDSFKQLNDRRGHHVGDVMLIAIADRLRDAARPGDVVARVGGDEFVVVLTELRTLLEAKELAERITAAAGSPIFYEDTELRPILSVGLAFSAHRETDPNQLVIDADSSMLAVKKSRRQGGPSSESTINISPHRSARINDIVADAIDNEKLTVVFQPIVNMIENRIWGYEALVRLTDPDLGAISPGALVERAKSFGRMDELTRQVMSKAMTAARAIQLIEPSIATMTVNLEVGQITDDHLGLFAKNLADRYPSISLCLELNERSLRYVTDDLRRQSQALRDHGILIAIDDYGSENSSVGSLVRIPMDIIKLDRSLIDDLDDYRQREVVKALQSFSDSTDYLTIVEGIESKETAEILRRVGVRNAQGYYYGVPATYEQVVDRLNRHGTVALVPPAPKAR